MEGKGKAPTHFFRGNRGRAGNVSIGALPSMKIEHLSDYTVVLATAITRNNTENMRWLNKFSRCLVQEVTSKTNGWELCFQRYKLSPLLCKSRVGEREKKNPAHCIHRYRRGHFPYLAKTLQKACTVIMDCFMTLIPLLSGLQGIIIF